MKKGFGILIAIFSVLAFGVLSLYIMQNIALSSQLNINKYRYIQSSLHLEFAKEYIKTLMFDSIDFENLDLSDDKYDIEIDIKSEETKKIAHIFVSPKDDTTVRVYDKVVVLK
jgi:hypothetical protein